MSVFDESCHHSVKSTHKLRSLGISYIEYGCTLRDGRILRVHKLVSGRRRQAQGQSLLFDSTGRRRSFVET